MSASLRNSHSRPPPQKPQPVRYRRTFVTRHDALACLGENHAFRKCVAQLPKHRGEERTQEQSEYCQQQ